MQMSYNHFYRTSNVAGVTSLDYPIHVEVGPGHTAPFKKTTLQRKLMCMRHPPDPDSTASPMFIDGVHYVHTVPKRGHIQVIYCNLDKNEEYIEQFMNCLSSHIYLYLCEVVHYLA
jgi:hypothetical protein